MSNIEKVARPAAAAIVEPGAAIELPAIIDDAMRAYCLAATLDHPEALALPMLKTRGGSWTRIRSKGKTYEIRAALCVGLVRCYQEGVLRDDRRDVELAVRIWDRWLLLSQ